MIYQIDDRTPRIAADAFVADSATLIGSVILEAGASVWFGSVLRGDNDELVIGERSNVQDGSVLHTDPGLKLVIGREVTIGHCVMLHGCTIGDGTLVGIGARVLNGAQIGAESIVAAGSLVPERKRFPDGVMLMGSPAKVVRELSPAERKGLHAYSAVYMKHAQDYRATLKPWVRG
ncbi:MAG: gamma carbonic anhydrase family protein [Nevskiaceae bacterium]|nr:MAG: gamma carbonic anhydrase family protein [Nevskiaceae bacterium]TBR74639.1 MAG: gamma carbonic anhydrase family protein [Nevskiaceae bacterium]